MIIFRHLLKHEGIMRVFGVLLLLMMFAAAHAQDGPGRVACDSKWLDQHKPDSDYQKYLQDCMKKQQPEPQPVNPSADTSGTQRNCARTGSLPVGCGTFEGQATLPFGTMRDGKKTFLPTPFPYKARGTLVWKATDGKIHNIQVNQVGTCSVFEAPGLGLRPCFNVVDRAQITVVLLDWDPNGSPSGRYRGRISETVEATHLDTQRCFGPAPDVAILGCTEIIRLGQQIPQDDLARAFSNRGIAYAKNGQYDRAIQDYDRALLLKSDANVIAVVYLNRGIAYAKNSQYDRAIQDYDGAIKLVPNYALAFYHRGLARRAIGDSAGGDADIVKAKQINPNVGN